MSAHAHTHDDHGHHHGHDHGHHHHGHGHSHAPADFGFAFGIGITLNILFVIVGVAFGLIGHSIALIADAGHNLSDVLGLVMAWVASVLVKRAPTKRFTYGLRGTSILAALFNAVFLLVATGAIALGAIQRLFEPQPVAGKLVMIVAAIGIVLNGFTALLFLRGRNDDLNLRGAFLHMAGDAVISLGVVVAGLLILLTGWLWIDPVVSLAISAVIVAGTWSLLRDSLSMTLQGVPPGIDINAVRGFLEKCPGVCAIHDLHVWPMSTTEIAMTCHLVMPAGHPGDAFLHELAGELAMRFKINHPTVQIETDLHLTCALASDDVV
jgi:cobalt-zinc-cadmium efflux system protein